MTMTDAMDAFRRISMGELGVHEFRTEDRNCRRICDETRSVSVDINNRNLIASSLRDITERKLVEDDMSSEEKPTIVEVAPW